MLPIWKFLAAGAAATAIFAPGGCCTGISGAGCVSTGACSFLGGTTGRSLPVFCSGPLVGDTCAGSLGLTGEVLSEAGGGCLIWILRGLR
jgi:hypothetical protein